MIRVGTPLFVQFSKLMTTGGLKAFREESSDQLRQCKHELLELEKQKASLDLIVAASPKKWAIAGFTYFSLQTAILFHWVYFRFDWNLVEPITYLLGSATVWLSVFLFRFVRKEFSLDELKSLIEDKKRIQVYKKHNFTEKQVQMEALAKNIERLDEVVCFLKTF